MRNKFFAALMLAALTFSLMLPMRAAAAGETETLTVVETEESAENKTKTAKVWATSVLMGVAALGGTIAMAWSIIKATSNIAKQPEAAGNIRTAMMLGLVFVETVVIYALIVAILVVFVL